VELDEYRRMSKVEHRHWWYASTRALLQQLLTDRIRAGGRFLDLGCGTGATGSWLGETGELVSADREMLALTLNRENHPGAVCVNLDALALPFADGSFDAVLCVTMLYHRSIEAPDAVVAEIARVLAPGGIVCLFEPGVRRLWRAHDRETHAARRFAKRDLVEPLGRAGLDVVLATGAYSFLVPGAAAKTVLERNGSTSDLDRNESGLRGVLPAVASAERRLLRHVSLPSGLSVVAIGQRRSQVGGYGVPTSPIRVHGTQ
jgi:SAM-dependent methyltransferase